MLSEVLDKKIKQYGVTLPASTEQVVNLSKDWKQAIHELADQEKNPNTALSSMIDYWINVIKDLSILGGESGYHKEALRNVSDLKHHRILSITNTPSRNGQEVRIQAPYQLNGFSFNLTIVEAEGRIKTAYYSLFNNDTCKTFIRELEGSEWKN